MSRRAVFLDRDGVLDRAEVRNGRPYPPASVADVVILPGVADACHRLASAGWTLFVVTNQPDVARGASTLEDVEAINAAVLDGLPVACAVVCPHDDADDCHCRKPRPGMLIDLAAAWDVDLDRSVMIGDRWRDIAAGRRAGVRTILIDYGYDEQILDPPDHVVADLAAAADLLLDFDGPALT